MTTPETTPLFECPIAETLQYLTEEADRWQSWQPDTTSPGRERALIKICNTQPLDVVVFRYNNAGSIALKAIIYGISDSDSHRPPKSLMTIGVHPNSRSAYIKLHEHKKAKTIDAMTVLNGAIGWIERDFAYAD